MVARILPLSFTIATMTILMFTIWSSTDGYAYDFDDDCSSFWSCGNISNISFPFSWPRRPRHCGHQGLQLQCIQDYPLLQILGDDGHEIALFQLLGTWNNSKFLTMKLLQASVKNFCPVDFIKSNVLDKHLFNYSSNVNLASLTKCHDPFQNNKTLSSHSIICSDPGDQSMFVFYMPNQSDYQSSDEYKDEGCKTFQIPVLKEELNKLEHKKEILRDGLDKGFEVELDIIYATACVKCLNSGRSCGSMSSDQHVCYCKDSPPSEVSDVCSESGLINIQEEWGSKGDWKLKLGLGLGKHTQALILVRKQNVGTMENSRILVWCLERK